MLRVVTGSCGLTVLVPGGPFQNIGSGAVVDVVGRGIRGCDALWDYQNLILIANAVVAVAVAAACCWLLLLRAAGFVDPRVDRPRARGRAAGW